MAKPVRQATTPARPSRSAGGSIENSPYLVPVVFAVFFLALMILFSSFVFSDKMLSGSDTVNAGYYLRNFYVEQFKAEDHVPQWNPYIFGGMPYVEAFNGDIFYPLSFIKFILPLHRALGWLLILHIFLAGVFMYLAARQFKLGKVPSLFSAAAYMFAAYLISFVAPGHDGKLFVTALFPLAMLFLDRGFERKPVLNFTLLGLVIGAIVLTPHPQMSYFTLWALAAFTVFKMVVKWREAKNLVRAILPGSLAAYAVILGLLVAAIQFFPGYNYTTSFSPRADTKKGWEWATSWSMHQEEAMSLLIPEFPGANVGRDDSLYWGKNAFKDNSESVGAIAIFLALLGICYWRRKESWFFFGLGLFALIYALGATTPLFRLFFAIIPKVESLRAPAMIMFLFSFSAALLGGMGLQYIVNSHDKKAGTPGRFNYLLWGFPAFMFLLALLFTVGRTGMLDIWTSLFYSGAKVTMMAENFSKLDGAYRNLGSITAGAWFAFIFTALAAVCIWLYREKKAGPAILLALVGLPMIDGIRFNSRFIEVMNPRDMWAVTPWVQYIKQHSNQDRVLDLSQPKSNVLPFHDIPVVAGYHGNQLRWYDDLIGSIELKNLGNPNFLNLSGVKYLLSPRPQPTPEGYFGSRPLVTEQSWGQTYLLRNDNALPRVYLVDRYRVFPDRAQIYPEVVGTQDSLRRTVYLEEEPPISVTPSQSGPDSAWFASYHNDVITIGVQTSANKLLVLTDVWYDAWQVTVDGQPAKLLRAYGAYRAVAIPAGAREVKMWFESNRYATSRLITWLATVYIIGVCGVAFFWQRRRKSAASATTEVNE